MMNMSIMYWREREREREREMKDVIFTTYKYYRTAFHTYNDYYI